MLSTARITQSLTLSRLFYFSLDSAKSSGAYDDGEFENRCVWIQKNFVSDGMKAYFASPLWQNVTYWDNVLHAAVNRSLDLTIQALGPDTFARRLAEFRRLRRLVQQECSAQVKFPCLSNGTKLPPRETSCLEGDMGCGFECMDQVVAKDAARMG